MYVIRKQRKKYIFVGVYNNNKALKDVTLFSILLFDNNMTKCSIKSPYVVGRNI